MISHDEVILTGNEELKVHVMWLRWTNCLLLEVNGWSICSHVGIVRQHSAESCEFSQGSPFSSSHRES